MKKEGFWYSKREPHFPKPVSAKDPRWKKHRRSFLRKLFRVQEKAIARHFKGWSNCRMCEKRVGSVSYEYKDWTWPEGLEHYIRVHNVMPSKEFIVFIVKEAK